jgi:membrane protease YdiL (CAAX protease family)
VSAEAARCGLEEPPFTGSPAKLLTVVAACGYVAAITTAEALGAFVGPVPAAALDALLLVALVAHYVLSTAAGGPAAVAVPGQMYAALAVVPLLRLSALALAAGDPLLFHVVSPAPGIHLGPGMGGLLAAEAGVVPMLLATIMAAQVLRLPGTLPLSELRSRPQWCFALATFVLAAAASPLLGVGALTDADHPTELAVVVAVVFVAGALEELVFRGLVQGALDAVIGAWAVPLANVPFAAAYHGSGSVSYTASMSAFGLVCGWWVRRHGSLAGVATAHGLLSVGLLVLWPTLL